MSIYQRYFSEYTQSAGQILMTKNTMLDGEARKNAERTFEQLFSMGVIPVVNENDTLSTYEMQFGDNDTLSAIVCTLIKADLLILLSDIDGLFTADPKVDPEAKLVDYVEEIDEELESMAGNEP
jgi:glutamate 5-kinase